VPKLVTVAMPGRLTSLGQAAGAGLLDELVVGGHQFDERGLFDLTQRGDHDAVIDFDGEADIDGTRMHDAAADEATGDGGVFRQGQGEGADDVKRGAGLGIGFLRCASMASSMMGLPTVASGRLQLRRMLSATAMRIGEAGSCGAARARGGRPRNPRR
jgi:hypothetical protein